jgi:threonine/homoserine/homoserine lactone efflux protein
MLHYLLIGFTFAFAAAIQPGPLQAYLVSQALSHGWRRTWPAAFAPLLSDAPIAIIALSALHLAAAWLLSVLQCAGGLFLLYLAALAFKAWRTYGPRQRTESRGSLFKAAIVNVLNPNPYLGWSLVMGPLCLRAWQQAPRNAAALLLGFYATMIATTIGIILLFAAAAGLGPKVNRILVGISALALVLFAFYELWSGTRSLQGT